MDSSSVGDFINQVPVGLLLAPIFFGAIYVVVMVIIFQRAAERRRRNRALRAAGGAAPMQAAVTLNTKPKRQPIGAFLSGQLPDKPMNPAQWSIPAGLRDLPEPDLEALSGVPLMIEPETIESASIAPSMDWLAMMTPASVLPSTKLSVQPSSQPSIQERTVMTTQTILPDAEPNSNRKGFDSGDAVEVMRIWRDLTDGSLIIQMGDQRYRTANDIANPELLRRFTGIVRELWAMVNNSLSGRSADMLPAVDNAGIPLPSGSAGSLKARIGMLAQQNEPDDSLKQQRSGLLRQVTRTAMGQSATPAAEPRRDGIADAVEQFLQFRLSHTPEFQTRSIHVRPSIDGGVRIEVDGHFYNGVNDVIDPDVRDLLLTVLREWEARQ